MTDISFKVIEQNATQEYAEFIIEPLDSGYGHTLGSALRRVLLTSISGAAITAVKIAGVKHKFSEIPGVKENVIDLLLNLKGLNIRLAEGKDSGTLRLSAKKSGEVTGKNIEASDGVEVVNTDHYIAFLSGDKAKLDIELTIERGYGFSLSEERHIDTIGVMPTDAVFSPVKRVNYTVETTRVGRKTNYDKVTLQVWTNGSVTPKEALENSAKMLTSYFTQIYQPKVVNETQDVVASSSMSDDVLKMTVDELDLPTRIYNSLRNGGIETLADLLNAPRKELISMRNMGIKSISIIEDKLKEKGISLQI